MNTYTEDVSVKAEITVVFKTGNLMSKSELNEKYNGDVEKAIADMINLYPLHELTEDKYQISSIRQID